MKNYQEYQRLCQSIDQIQWQMFKQGKKHNEFMQRDLLRLQEQMRNMYLNETNKNIQERPRVEGHKPEGRKD